MKKKSQTPKAKQEPKAKIEAEAELLKVQKRIKELEKSQASRYLVQHFGLLVQNELANATIDSFCPSRLASATISYDMAHKWARLTPSCLPQ